MIDIPAGLFLMVVCFFSAWGGAKLNKYITKIKGSGRAGKKETITHQNKLQEKYKCNKKIKSDSMTQTCTLI